MDAVAGTDARVSRTYGVLILAGGEATRLPGKLALDAGDVPMLVRVYRNFADADGAPLRETYVSCKGALDPRVDALLPVPAVVDRWRRRGPLGGLLSTLVRMRSRYVFVTAGDAPFVDAAFADALAARLEPGDEAVVPERSDDIRGGYLEPLAALYDRAAFVRAGMPVLRGGRGKLGLVIAAMSARRVAVGDARALTNVNTPADYAALREELRR